MGVTGRSELVIPLEGLPSMVPPLERGATTPHITLVSPFVDPDDLDDGLLRELEEFFADVVPFQVRLDRLSRFPGGTAYLAPDSVAPFRHLVHELARRFPDLPRGQVGPATLPHVEVPLDEGQDLSDLEAELEPWLPAITLAREADVWWVEDGEARRVADFPFGTTAA